MAFGNRLGMDFSQTPDPQVLFTPSYGSLILEIDANVDLEQEFAGVPHLLLGHTTAEERIVIGGQEISLQEACKEWRKPLEKVFPGSTGTIPEKSPQISVMGRNTARPRFQTARPRVLIPVFPGTNGEYDSIRAFEKAGGRAETLVFNNLTPADIEVSIKAMEKKIKEAQIMMIPGGASAGDEPDGSGKFIAAIFRHPRIKEAVTELMEKRDGLILGICNGFQALVRLGLLPYGEIRDITEASPALTINAIGRHVSRMVRTRVTSSLSPWLRNVEVGDIHTIAVSHGVGRFIAEKELLQELAQGGQIATQYVDLDGRATGDFGFNPSGSLWAVEGITSPDGRILGKMGHSERIGPLVAINVPGEKDQRIFAAGVAYFQ
jgi:phosphoribosylformylglycinamidine synthase